MEESLEDAIGRVIRSFLIRVEQSTDVAEIELLSRSISQLVGSKVALEAHAARLQNTTTTYTD